MSYVEVDGNKIWFEKYGTGPEVVLLIPGPIGESFVIHSTRIVLSSNLCVMTIRNGNH